jgi:hypothetical protein
MIYCEICTRFKRVIAIEGNDIVLLCGHIVQPEGNRAYCSKCETLVSVLGFDGLRPVLSCGHVRSDHDNDMDNVINDIREDIDKNPDKIKKIVSNLNKLLDPQYLKEFLEYKNNT